MSPTKKLPMYRVSQWLDTSNLNLKSLPIRYGIQINQHEGNGWNHVAIDGVAAVFKNTSQAIKKIDELKAADKEPK